MLRFILRTVGSWPGRILGENNWRITDYYVHFIRLYSICAWLLNIVYLIQQFNNVPFLIVGHSLITATCCFTSTLKVLILPTRKVYHEISKIFFMEMHLFYFKNKSEHAMKVYRQVNRISEIVTFYLATLTFVTVIFFNGGPIYVNFTEGVYTEGIPENSTKIYAQGVYYAFPFKTNYLTDFKEYFIVFLYNWNVSYYCGAILVLYDLYIYLIVFHIWGHFKILIKDLEMIPKPSNDASKKNEELVLEKYGLEESFLINKKMQDCIDYHRLIMKFFKMISVVFGPTLLAYTGFLMFIICLLLLEISYLNVEAFVQYGLLTVLSFLELIQFGLVFELIGTAGENLEKAVYDLPWEYMDIENRKIVLFFLMNVQKPTRVRPTGVIEMGVATVASVLKTSFSYFTFLRTIE